MGKCIVDIPKPVNAVPSIPSPGSSSSSSIGLRLCFPEEKKRLRVGLYVMVSVVFLGGVLCGTLFLITVHDVILLLVVLGVFALLGVLVAWNLSSLGRHAFYKALLEFQDVPLGNVKDGQYVKITGVVNCGNSVLESSYEKVPRCVYTSTAIHEYKGCKVDTSPKSWCHPWGVSYLERHVVDFYITDCCSGSRILVKVGEGLQLISCVKETTIIDIGNLKKRLSPHLLNWLRERHLPCHRRKFQLKEGYIREGNVISVFGVIQQSDDMLTIVPPNESFSTGCHWKQCLMPVNIQGMVILLKDT